jgi:potassium-transporting ATPase ATP-binding subunit
MHLHSTQSAILSAIIFNALIIVVLIPLALKGIAYRAIGAAALLRRNLLIYGVGGLVAPFVGIKIIDIIVSAVGLAGAVSGSGGTDRSHCAGWASPPPRGRA